MKIAMPELALIPAPASSGDDRQLPRNVEAEAAFLGAILIDKRTRCADRQSTAIDRGNVLRRFCWSLFGEEGKQGADSWLL